MKRYQMSYPAVVGIKASANRSAPFCQRAGPLDKNERGDTEDELLKHLLTPEHNTQLLPEASKHGC